MEALESISKYKNTILRILVLILALLVSRSIYNKDAQKLETLKAQRETETKRGDMLEKIAQLEKRLSAYRQFLGKKDASSVITSITNIVREAGVNIVSIRPAVGEKYILDTKAPYSKLPFSLTISAANYHLIGKFVSKIESCEEDIFQIEVIEITPNTQSKELNVNLTINNIRFADSGNNI